MTDYQKAEIKMMKEVVNFFDNNPNLEKDNKILKKHVDDMREKLKEIESNEIKQNFDSTGYTENKNKVKIELADLDFNITSGICSFANDSGKNELYNEFKTPISKVKIMSDADLVNYSHTISLTAEQYKKDLEPYNVTADELVNLTKLTDDYEKILLIPAEARKEKSVATANIKALIPDILQILKRSIDRDMVHYKDSDSDLYEKYLNLREIDDSKTTALSIIGEVHDADSDCDGTDDCPLQHVKCTVKFKAGHAWKETVKMTTEKGNFQFAGLPDGKCTLTFELEFYDTITKEIAVYSDKATKVNIKMKRTI